MLNTIAVRRLKEVLVEILGSQFVRDASEEHDKGQGEDTEELVQGVIFLHQLLHQSKQNASHQNFHYFFQWSETGPSSDHLKRRYQTLMKSLESVNSKKGGMSEPIRNAQELQELIISPENISRSTWVEILSRLAYRCSPHRIENHELWEIDRAKKETRESLDVPSEVVDEAVEQLQQKRLIG